MYVRYVIINAVKNNIINNTVTRQNTKNELATHWQQTLVKIVHSNVMFVVADIKIELGYGNTRKNV
jgi:hypothetical protein